VAIIGLVAIITFGMAIAISVRTVAMAAPVAAGMSIVVAFVIIVPLVVPPGNIVTMAGAEADKEAVVAVCQVVTVGPGGTAGAEKERRHRGNQKISSSFHDRLRQERGVYRII
jgi:hypothetical protein